MSDVGRQMDWQRAQSSDVVYTSWSSTTAAQPLYTQYITPTWATSAATTTNWISGDTYWVKMDNNNMSLTAIPMKPEPLLPPELFEFED